MPPTIIWGATHRHQEGTNQCSLQPFAVDLNEDDALCTLQATLEKTVFDCSLQIKKLLHQSTDASSLTSDGKGVKLPKLDVPTFDGNILNCRSFWEQFCVSVHDRPSLSDPEKLVHLQHSLKKCSTKKVIESLSRSVEFYVEAIECLMIDHV